MLFFIFCLVVAVSASTRSILALSDLHVDLFYKERGSIDSRCRDDQLKEERPAPLGRVGCDAPVAMLETLLEKAALENPDVKVIIINGDTVAHYVAQDYGEQALEDTITLISQKIRAHFPKAVALPSIGNNDLKLHNNVPKEAEALQYYRMLLHIWFRSPANRRLITEEARDTFLRGGFYRVDLEED